MYHEVSTILQSTLTFSCGVGGIVDTLILECLPCWLNTSHNNEMMRNTTKMKVMIRKPDHHERRFPSGQQVEFFQCNTAANTTMPSQAPSSARTPPRILNQTPTSHPRSSPSPPTSPSSSASYSHHPPQPPSQSHPPTQHSGSTPQTLLPSPT